VHSTRGSATDKQDLCSVQHEVGLL